MTKSKNRNSTDAPTQPIDLPPTDAPIAPPVPAPVLATVAVEEERVIKTQPIDTTTQPRTQAIRLPSQPAPQPAPVAEHFPRAVVHQLTDVGRKRDHNEDYAGYRVVNDLAVRQYKGDLYLVADGMGGYQAGEVASKLAVETVLDSYYTDDSNNAALSLIAAVRKANAAVYGQSHSNTNQRGMGTTLVGAAVRGKDVTIANVGDCRAYLVRSASIVQISADHSFVAEQVRAGLLTPEQARVHPNRNVITRALGADPDVLVDTFEGAWVPGDTLVMCSDGLHGLVSDAEIAWAVTYQSLAEAAQWLVDRANERGGPDNITIMLLKAPGSLPGSGGS